MTQDLGIQDQAEAIRAARTSRRMSQAHLAKAALVSAKTVIRAEAGQAILDENLRSICSVLGLDAAALSKPYPAEPRVEASVALADDCHPGTESDNGSPPAAFIPISMPTRRRIMEAFGIVVLAGGSGFLGGYVASGPTARREAATPMLSTREAGMPTDRGVAEVSAWISTAVARMFAIDFAAYRAQIAASADLFTPAGMTAFQDMLRTSGVIDSVIAQKYVMAAVPTAAPHLVSQGSFMGRAAWRLEMPVVTTWQSAQRQLSSNSVLRMLVLDTEGGHGLRIAGITAV